MIYDSYDCDSHRGTTLAKGTYSDRHYFLDRGSSMWMQIIMTPQEVSIVFHQNNNQQKIFSVHSLCENPCYTTINLLGLLLNVLPSKMLSGYEWNWLCPVWTHPAREGDVTQRGDSRNGPPWESQNEWNNLACSPAQNGWCLGLQSYHRGWIIVFWVCSTSQIKTGGLRVNFSIEDYKMSHKMSLFHQTI